MSSPVSRCPSVQNVIGVWCGQWQGIGAGGVYCQHYIQNSCQRSFFVATFTCSNLNNHKLKDPNMSSRPTQATLIRPRIVVTIIKICVWNISFVSHTRIAQELWEHQNTRNIKTVCRLWPEEELTCEGWRLDWSSCTEPTGQNRPGWLLPASIHVLQSRD